MTSSGDENDVASADEEIVLIRSVGDLPVVEGHTRRRWAVLANDDDSAARREFGESLRLRDELEHRRRTLHLIPAGNLDGPDDRHLDAVDFAGVSGDTSRGTA